MIHEKLEEYYNCVFEEIDEIAEHILINGSQPLGRLCDYLEKTKLKEAENKKVNRETIFKDILADYKLLYEDAKRIKESAEEAKDYGTSSLIDDYIIKYGKKIWMLSASKEIA